MFSSKKETKKINLFNNFFSSLKSHRAVFFVFLAILVLGFSVKVSLAVTYTQDQKLNLQNAYKLSEDQISNLQKSNIAYNDFEKKVNDLMQKPAYNNAPGAAANFTYNDIANPATMYSNTGSDVGGQVNVEGENLLVKALLGVVIGVLSIIVYFLKFLVSWSGALVDLALNPNLYSFTNNDMIKQGWVVVRDICNLFFLLALLFIAICTILKIEKYHVKKTLLMLIIMALLINFSKPIAIFIFDGSQLLMNFFLSQLNSGQQSPSTIYTGAAKIADSIYTNIPKYFGSSLDSPSIALIYLFSTIFLFMLAVAYLVTAIFLIIRIVAIMILIIVSPLAFFAAIIPDFSKMSSKWWSALFEYSYYGPAAAFFLLLATKLQNSLPNLGNITVAGDQNVSVIISNMVHYLVVVIFLYASIIMAKQFGGGAGAAVVGNANRFMKWAGKGAAMAPYRATAWGAKTTGVSGAVTQRLQQSKLGRLLTKSGREEALEEREAKMAERFGVKGAKERQVRKRAKKLKDEGYSEAALKAMVANGDEAAGYRLAEDGNMDDTAYSAIISKIKDPKLKKLLDDKTKEKTIDVYINYKAKDEAAALAATTPGMTIAAAESQIAGEEYNKMNADNWKNQKEKSRIFTSTYATEAATGFNNLHLDARKDVGKSVSGKDKVAMTAGGAAIP